MLAGEGGRIRGVTWRAGGNVTPRHAIAHGPSPSQHAHYAHYVLWYLACFCLYFPHCCRVFCAFASCLFLRLFVCLFILFICFCAKLFVFACSLFLCHSYLLFECLLLLPVIFLRGFGFCLRKAPEF